MHSLFIEPAAEEDLDELWNSSSSEDQDAADLIAVTLEEIDGDEDFLSRMYRRDVTRGGEPTINADNIVSQWRKGKNLVRLKVWDFPEYGGVLIPWRIICAYDALQETYYVLGIIKRESNYDENNPRVQRILRDYDALGLPTY